MTPEPRKQTIAIHMLPNILRSKGNQTMKFGQLMENKLGNNFLENSLQNVLEKLFPDKKSKLSISMNQYSKVLYNLFLLYSKLRAIEI